MKTPHFLWAVVCCCLSTLFLGFLIHFQPNHTENTIDVNIHQIFSRQIEAQLNDVLGNIVPPPRTLSCN